MESVCFCRCWNRYLPLQPWDELVEEALDRRPTLSAKDIYRVRKAWECKDRFLAFYLFNELFDNAQSFLHVYIVQLVKLNGPVVHIGELDRIVKHLDFVIDGFENLVESLDQPDDYVKNVNKIIEPHKKLRSVGMEQYKELFRAVDHALKACLRPRAYGPKRRMAFRKFLLVVYFDIKDRQALMSKTSITTTESLLIMKDVQDWFDG